MPGCPVLAPTIHEKMECIFGCFALISHNFWFLRSTISSKSQAMKFAAATLFVLATVAKTIKAQRGSLAFLKGIGTPDGFTPGANGFASICDNYEKNAKALCNLYCQAHDCYLDEDEINVPAEVCESVYDRFMDETEEEPPCVKPCPCWDASDFVDTDLTCTFFPRPDGEGGISQVTDGDLIAGEASFLAFASESADFPICAIGDPNSPTADILGFLTTEQAEACVGIINDAFEDCPVFVPPPPPPSPPVRK